MISILVARNETNVELKLAYSLVIASSLVFDDFDNNQIGFPFKLAPTIGTTFAFPFGGLIFVWASQKWPTLGLKPSAELNVGVDANSHQLGDDCQILNWRRRQD